MTLIINISSYLCHTEQMAAGAWGQTLLDPISRACRGMVSYLGERERKRDRERARKTGEERERQSERVRVLCNKRREAVEPTRENR